MSICKDNKALEFILLQPLGHKKKKKKLFYRQTDLPKRVGWSGVFVFVFVFLVSGSKNDIKNTKISTKKKKKTWHFLQKNFGKIFWLFLKYFQLEVLDFDQKTADFIRFWKNFKNKTKQKKKNERNSAKTETFGRSCS